MARQALPVDGTRDSYPLGRVLLALEDPQRTLTIEDVAQTAIAARFQPALPPRSNVDVNFGYSESAWWLALPLALDAGAATRWLLEIGYPSLDWVEVYVPRPGGGHDKLVAGDLQRFSERPYPHRNLVFPLTLAPGEAQTVYLRVVSAGNLTIPATLWQPDALAHHDQLAYSLLSLYYGMLLALGIYNLLLYLAIRDTTFLAYVAFTVSMAIAQASMNGLGNQFLWPEWPAWGNVALPSGMAATGFFGAIFTRLFLGTRQRAPLLDRYIAGCAVLLAFTAFSPLLLPYQWVAVLVSLLGILFGAVAVFSGVYCVQRRYPGARYFLLAWTFLLLGGAVLGMRNLDWLPTTWLTFNAMQIGSALEILLLSFALGDRISGMRREKELANEAALTARQQMVEALRKAEHELESRVAERTVALETLNSQLREKETQLEHLVRHDPLTGLANRILLKDRVERAVTRARRSHNGVALLMVDLDGFKQVNDAYGHSVGDALLVVIAGRLKECVRETDTVARLGGDEFVVLLEETRHPRGTGHIAEKLIAAVQQPVTLPAGTVTVSASIGIACIPEHADTAEELLDRADAAMYAAKAAGRNRWHVAPEIAV
ncbi:MAG: diguanylate cyclase protein [Proteobacteria bacterium]|nr:diguanylate cyclase protein [Pseudomonadota bacterium]